jgi:predicted transcriptional regulator
MKQSAAVELPDLDTIRDYLRRQKISQLSLEQSSGVPQSVISRILNGEIKDPSYSTIRKLLLTMKNPKNPKTRGNTNDSQIINELTIRTAEELMSKKIISVKPHNKLIDVWKVMKANNFSQIPVFDDRNRSIGSISESFLAAYVSSQYEMERRIDELETEDSFPMVGKNTTASTVADILKTKQAVLVVERGKAIGIITKHDLIDKRSSSELR